MALGKENNAGDAKVWSVEDDLVVYDHLKSYMPGPKLAKSPKVAALVAKLSASAEEIVARYGELVDISGPARLRLDEAVKAKARAREGLAVPAKKAPPKAKKSGGAAKPVQAKKTTSGAGAKPKKKKARVATPAPPRSETPLLDMMLNGPPVGSQVLVRWEGAPGPERDGCWRAVVCQEDGKLWLVGAQFDPTFGEPMPFDPVQDPPQLWAPVPVAPPLAPPPAGRSCTCGVPAVRRTAQTDRNFGRVFYACRYGRDAGCGYFDWEDGGGVGGVDMRRVQLLATLHARGALSDVDYAQAMALEFRALR